jgi:hypothetical protein
VYHHAWPSFCVFLSVVWVKNHCSGTSAHHILYVCLSLCPFSYRHQSYWAKGPSYSI